MTTAPPTSALLEANDTDRAKALKAKIRDRMSDVRRHLLALRAAMAEFGEDFELDAFRKAYTSEDPVELNRVKAVERGVDQLYNYIAELAAFGLELAEIRGRRDETNARRDLDALRKAGVLSGELTRLCRVYWINVLSTRQSYGKLRKRWMSPAPIAQWPLRLREMFLSCLPARRFR